MSDKAVSVNRAAGRQPVQFRVLSDRPPEITAESERLLAGAAVAVTISGLIQQVGLPFGCIPVVSVGPTRRVSLHVPIPQHACRRRPRTPLPMAPLNDTTGNATVGATDRLSHVIVRVLVDEHRRAVRVEQRPCPSSTETRVV